MCLESAKFAAIGLEVMCVKGDALRPHLRCVPKELARQQGTLRAQLCVGLCLSLCLTSARGQLR